MKLFYSFKIIFCFFCIVITSAEAQTITENQRLSFGKIVLVDNAAVRQVSLLPSGSYVADPEYIFFTDPQLGNVTVDGYPPATPLTVSVGTATLTPSGGGIANFSIGSTFTNPAIIVTDATGSVTFDIGAILSSDGSGTSITDGLYDGSYVVTVAP